MNKIKISKKWKEKQYGIIERTKRTNLRITLATSNSIAIGNRCVNKTFFVYKWPRVTNSNLKDVFVM